MCGQGVLTMSDKTRFEGQFFDNKPNGIVKISLPKSNFYDGEVKEF